MKKCLSVFMIALLIFTGCEDKANDKLDDLKSEENQNQINDDNTETDIKQTITDENGNKIEINIPANNIGNKNENNNLGNKNENSNISDDLNNNTDKNDKTDDSDDKETNEKLINPTITYSCGTAFDYKLEKDKCIRTETTASLSTNTCPSGYIYKSGKCYTEKNPTTIRYCDNKDYTLEGDLCLDGRTRAASEVSLFYKPSTNSVADTGISYRLINEVAGYKELAQVTCYSNHTKKTDESTKTSYCLNLNNERVPAQSVTCTKTGLKLTNNGNTYQCTGTKYNYYSCSGKLVGTTCYTGKRVNYGMYCDDGSEIVNAKCQYVTNVKPITTGNCPNNYEPISGNPRICSREWVTDAQKTYNCPSGYILTSDYKCKLK